MKDVRVCDAWVVMCDFNQLAAFFFFFFFQEKKMLNSTQRLIAFAILHQAYASQKPSANPFVNFLISVSTVLMSFNHDCLSSLRNLNLLQKRLSCYIEYTLV